MTVPYIFEFSSGIPSLEEIFNHFESKTGLTIESKPFTEFHFLIKTSEFEEELRVSFGEERVEFYINNFVISYFIATFISTLIHLGGKLQKDGFQLPFWSDLKWDELLKNWNASKYNWNEIKTDEEYIDLIWDDKRRIEQYDKQLTSWYKGTPIIFLTA